jgi:hypothetical protein
MLNKSTVGLVLNELPAYIDTLDDDDADRVTLRTLLINALLALDSTTQHGGIHITFAYNETVWRWSSGPPSPSSSGEAFVRLDDE